MKLAGVTPEIPDRIFDFYYRIIRESLGFFGSRIINHTRRCHNRTDFEEIIDELRGKRLPQQAKELKEICKGVLKHLDYEDRWIRGNAKGYPKFKSLYNSQSPVHIGVTHSLGYLLGDRIYDALMRGRIRRNEVRYFFRQGFADGTHPREAYFDWIDYLKELDE